MDSLEEEHNPSRGCGKKVTSELRRELRVVSLASREANVSTKEGLGCIKMLLGGQSKLTIEFGCLEVLTIVVRSKNLLEWFQRKWQEGK